ncbi:uncharacterized protein LOC135820665 [Sycon ciliatum]|uniref:uncharacterized protein LOC135820665 n=1 Tax=Sycon ciliatum TaxID=27933 RepID=UPI0031F7156F
MESRFGPTATVATRATRDARARVYKGFTFSLLLSCFLVSQEGVLTTLDFEDLSDSGSAIFASLQFFFSTGTLDIMSSVTMISLAIVAVLLATCTLTNGFQPRLVEKYVRECKTGTTVTDWKQHFSLKPKCKDVDECTKYQGICDQKKLKHPYPLSCKNYHRGYSCELPGPDEGLHYSGDEIIKDFENGVFRFQCPEGKFPYCNPGTECDYRRGALAPLKWDQGSSQYIFYNVPTCRPLAIKICAGLKIYHGTMHAMGGSGLASSYADAEKQCQGGGGFQQVNLAFSQIQFNQDTLNCLAGATTQTWTKDHHSIVYPGKAIGRVRADAEIPVLCISLHYRRDIDRSSLKLQFENREHTCHGGVKLYYLANSGLSQGRTRMQAQDACQERATYVPGPQLLGCMKALILSLSSSEALKCRTHGSLYEVVVCLQRVYRRLAWVGFSGTSAGRSLATDGQSYSNDQHLPYTICTSG